MKNETDNYYAIFDLKNEKNNNLKSPKKTLADSLPSTIVNNSTDFFNAGNDFFIEPNLNSK